MLIAPSPLPEYGLVPRLEPLEPRLEFFDLLLDFLAPGVVVRGVGFERPQVSLGLSQKSLELAEHGVFGEGV